MTFSLTPALAFTAKLSTITAATLNYWRTAISQAIDGAAGGTYLPTSAIEIGNAGLRVDGTLAYASSSVTRTVDTDAFDIVGTSSKGGLPANVAVSESIGAAIRVPHGNVLSSVTVYISPAVDGNLPATKPLVSVLRRDLNDGTVSTLGSLTDPAASAAAYEQYHGITVSGLASTIDRSRYMYSIRFDGEAGANSQAVLVVGATYTITSTAQDKGTG